MEREFSCESLKWLTSVRGREYPLTVLSDKCAPFIHSNPVRTKPGGDPQGLLGDVLHLLLESDVGR